RPPFDDQYGEGKGNSRSGDDRFLYGAERGGILRGQKVLVTGGSGFIGAHLIHRLLEDDAQIAVMVRYGNVIKNERLRDCWDSLRVIESDLRNRGALASIRQFDPEVVFHLAAYNHVGESFRQVEE